MQGSPTRSCYHYQANLPLRVVTYKAGGLAEPIASQGGCFGTKGSVKRGRAWHTQKLLPCAILMTMWWLGPQLHQSVPKVMHLLHCLFFIRTHYNFSVRAVYVTGSNMVGLMLYLATDCLISLHRSRGPSAGISSFHLFLVEQQHDWTSADWTQLFGRCFL